MDFKTVLGAVVVSILLFLGIIFAIASVYVFNRIIAAAAFFIAGFGLIYYLSKKPKTLIQKVEFSGELKAVALKCPNCSASINAEQIKIVSGVPYATCSYCGQTFEVTEEPKW